MKFVISNCSSMILEALSIEKNCFYVDPNNSLSNITHIMNLIKICFRQLQ